LCPNPNETCTAIAHATNPQVLTIEVRNRVQYARQPVDTRCQRALRHSCEYVLAADEIANGI
jgi:hypothetical protein